MLTSLSTEGKKTFPSSSKTNQRLSSIVKTNRILSPKLCQHWTYRLQSVHLLALLSTGGNISVCKNISFNKNISLSAGPPTAAKLPPRLSVDPKQAGQKVIIVINIIIRINRILIVIIYQVCNPRAPPGRGRSGVEAAGGAGWRRQRQHSREQSWQAVPPVSGETNIILSRPEPSKYWALIG